MRVHNLPPTDWLKAVAAGIGTAVLLSAVMVPALKLGLSPLPKPVGLAFAEMVLGGLCRLLFGRTHIRKTS